MYCADSEGGGVDTFIVRIYRRASDPADAPAGTVECVGSGERQGFAGREELWDRLFAVGGRDLSRERHGESHES